jgi:hypothetical protein
VGWREGGREIGREEAREERSLAVKPFYATRII